MCGIVGYTGEQEAMPIILEGLKRLEYRGYDSAGIATLDERNHIELRRSVGKLHNLEQILKQSPMPGHVGIGHTRWATHGKPSDVNAHPHVSMHGEVVVIHNGIIENFLPLRQELEEQGYRFVSETDTEVLPHMIEDYIRQGMNLTEAVRATLHRIKGAAAIAVMSVHEPETLVGARIANAGGVVVGYGNGEMFLASDIPAILPYTHSVVFLNPAEVVTVTPRGATYTDIEGKELSKQPQTVAWDPVAAEKGGYKHFMEKEIYEQPRALTDTIRGRVDLHSNRVLLDSANLDVEMMRNLTRAISTGMGTSRHAAMVGKYIIEELAAIPTESEVASEFRYRNPYVGANTLFIALTQSGETVDTLEAMAEAKRKAARILGVTNAVGSEASRVSDGVIYLHAGPEIAVASTKTFTCTLVDLALLGLYLGQARGTVSAERASQLLHAINALPALASRVLEESAANRAIYENLARKYGGANNFLHLGRGINYPIALEGALKLKEISYIHAEGFAAGEMKHGGIALIDRDLPSVVIAPLDNVHDKMISSIEQIRARDGRVIAIATEGDEEIKDKADDVIYIPATDPLLVPVLATLPLQLLAYHIAVRRGADVDQPRNLAKSVTVE
jgi:glutamine---fructose-6-phosphate transaminase (isomerizing)